MKKHKRLRSPRNRIVWGSLLVAVIFLGLSSRSFSESLPEWIAAHAGDALWTVALFLGLALLFPRWASLRLGILAFILSVLVEISQAIDTPWLNAARDTVPGQLLLGQVFAWEDFPRYFLGALLATLLDWILTIRHR